MTGLNLFDPAHYEGAKEAFETLLQLRNVTIERIFSPPGTGTETLRQTQDEWVCLLQGEAQLEMDERKIRLTAGDVLFIPAGTPHRVLDTSQHPTCIWLAVHIR